MADDSCQNDCNINTATTCHMTIPLILRRHAHCRHQEDDDEEIAAGRIIAQDESGQATKIEGPKRTNPLLGRSLVAVYKVVAVGLGIGFVLSMIVVLLHLVSDRVQKESYGNIQHVPMYHFAMMEKYLLYPMDLISMVALAVWLFPTLGCTDANVDAQTRKERDSTCRTALVCRSGLLVGHHLFAYVLACVAGGPLPVSDYRNLFVSSLGFNFCLVAMIVVALRPDTN